jgi:hypothetical protein
MVKHRIASISSSRVPLRCVCDSTKEIHDPYHPHVCPIIRKNNVYNRHEILVRTLEACARHAGAITNTKTPIDIQRLPEEGNITPDLFVNTGINKYMIDVSIVYPCADSHIGIASNAQCAAAAKRENEKKTKYDRFANRNGYTFVPFVMETFGAIGKCAEQFIRDLSNTTNDESNCDYFKRRCAIALQRGNALTMKQGAWLMRKGQGL